MRTTIAVSAVMIGAALIVPPPSIAADQQGGGTVPTVTRLVKIFLEKEQTVGTAIRNGDSAALEALLTDDFELRDGAQPGIPVPRADWLRGVLRARGPAGSVSGIAVHDVGGIAIASFSESTATGPVFIVDVWRPSGTDWKLAVRYATNPRAPLAGSAIRPAPAEIPKKY